MKRWSSPFDRILSARALRGALAAGLAVAAVATTRPLASGAVPAAAPDGPSVTLPLEGPWQTFANGDRINRLLRDGDVVWSATDGGGLVKWNLQDNTYVQFLAPQDGLRSNVVNDLELVPDGTLWLATDRGLSRLDATTQTITTLTPATSPGMPAEVVTALERTNDGHLWVGFGQAWDPVAVDPHSRTPGTFKRGGLARFAPEAGTWDNELHAELDGPPQNERYKTIPSENLTELEFGSDGILWIGTRQYYVWDQNSCGDSDCIGAAGYWVLAGGGLAATKGGDWRVWRAWEQAAAGCFSNHITDLAADVDGRMWAATAGRGLLLMREGLSASGCSSGQAYYTRARRDWKGLRGNYVWAVDIDETGRVWIAQGEGRTVGMGIGVLTHNNTFEDSSASSQPWNTDDEYEFYDFEGSIGESQVVVTALAVGVPGARIVGTKDETAGDGFGVRAFAPETRVWTPLRTADNGLPSNHVSSVALQPTTGHLWVATRLRGVARYDGQSWRSWRMFQAGAQVARVTQQLSPPEKGYDRVPVDLADAAAFNAAFPSRPRYARIGDDPVLYQVKGFVTLGSGASETHYIEVSPRLRRITNADTPVFAVDRGPASDAATQIDFDAQGNVWIGGRETVWQSGPVLGSECPTFPECWLDGGLSKWDGANWTVYVNDKPPSDLNQIPDQEVQSVAVDRDGKLWVGTGNPADGEGDGIGVLDPASNTWTRHQKALGSRIGGDGIADLSLDEAAGHVWAAHHATNICAQSGPFGGSCTLIRIGGGVSRWNGSTWQTWKKSEGATIRAFGNEGDLKAILVDPARDRVWAGGWDAVPKQFHWTQGIGINAVLNWCPLSSCTNTGWQSKTWPNDGEVVDLALDDANNLWVATHRSGMGITPPEAGIKLFDGTDWQTITPANSGVVSNEPTGFALQGEDMWVGTFRSGLSRYVARIPATPTPRATSTPRATNTDEPTPTVEGATQGPPPPTGTGPAPTQGPSPTNTPPRPTSVPGEACNEGRWCSIFLPFSQQRSACGRCTPVPPQPTPTRVPPTATTGVGQPTDVPTQAPTPAEPTPAEPTPGQPTEPPTPPPTDQPPGPTATQGQSSPTPTSSRTATATPTATATSTAGPTAPPVKAWEIFEGASAFPRDNFYGVTGTDAGHVWFVGERGQVLFWDGQQIFSQTAPTANTLRRIFMLSPTQGFIVGDAGTFLQTTNGGLNWRVVNTSSQIDDWRAVGVVRGAEGLRGWVLGHDKGTRLFFDGTDWATTSPADRNTGHLYSDMVMLGPSAAMATQDNASGSRIYLWNGTNWTPGPSTGVLSDMHVLSATQGVAVGARGSVWRLGANGVWAAMASRPTTGGQDLFAVHMLSDDLIWAGGGRTGLYLWDGISWTSRSVPAQVRTVRGMWLTPDGADGWAIGDDGLVLRYK